MVMDKLILRTWETLGYKCGSLETEVQCSRPSSFPWLPRGIVMPVLVVSVDLSTGCPLLGTGIALPHKS